MKVEDEEKTEQDDEKMTDADQDPPDRVTSTRELAKDLERTASGKADHSANATLFPENESRDFHKRWRTFKRRSWTSRDRQLNERTSWLQK